MENLALLDTDGDGRADLIVAEPESGQLSVYLQQADGTLAALMERGQLQSVFVVEDGVAHTRSVTTGRRANNAVEVLSGLNAGEKVVLPVPVGLQDGARVEVRQ